MGLKDELLNAHKAQPQTVMYAMQRLINQHSLAELDAAYDELVKANAVVQRRQIVSVVGTPRSAFQFRT